MTRVLLTWAILATVLCAAQLPFSYNDVRGKLIHWASTTPEMKQAKDTQLAELLEQADKAFIPMKGIKK